MIPAVFLAMSLGSMGALYSSAVPPPAPSPLKHLIFIVQENRTFDSYFGTFPGADGFPNPLPCLPDSWHPSTCDSPYPNHMDGNNGGAHSNQWQEVSIDGGKMDGFVISKEEQLGNRCHARADGSEIGVETDDEGIGRVAVCTIDVMGYHDGTDIPNYWAYASNYVLQDHFYESDLSWSLPNHLGIFSGWSASCAKLKPPDINSCASSYGGKVSEPGAFTPQLWTDITYLLHQNGVSWGVYLDHGQGQPFDKNAVPGIWSVLPGFETVQDDGEVANARLSLRQFYSDAAAGTLPHVSWVLPRYAESEHPQAYVSVGQAYVTGLINAVMAGPNWNDCAIFVFYDDPDGCYDHEPPAIGFDSLGLGMRVPAWIVSPYAKRGYIDHRICSSDCYLRLIEDTFVGGKRIRQAGRPDPRPDYRDEQKAYGNILRDFNLGQAPRPPLFLSQHPMSLLTRQGSPPP